MTPEELVSKNLRLARAATQRVPLHLREDAYAAALVGLWQSAQRFDPSRGVKFCTFAWYRVRGAVSEFLRVCRDDCELTEEIEAQLSDTATSPDVVYELREILERLRPADARLLIGHFIEGHTMKDMGTISGGAMSRKFKAALARARKVAA